MTEWQRQQIAGWLRANYEDGYRSFESWLGDADELIEIVTYSEEHVLKAAHDGLGSVQKGIEP